MRFLCDDLRAKKVAAPFNGAGYGSWFYLGGHFLRILAWKAISYFINEISTFNFSRMNNIVKLSQKLSLDYLET